MPAPVRFQIMATAADAVAGVRETKDAFRQLQAVTAEVATAARESAREQVIGLVKQREEIRNNIASFRELASATKRGSEEQTAALKLVRDEAQRLKATYLETAAAARGMGSAGAGGAAAGAEARGARGAFRGLTGISALGSTALLGGVVGGLALKDILEETKRAQESQALLRNALGNSGISWRQNREEIEKNLAAQEKLSGFDRVELRQSLATLVRGTHDFRKAQDELSIATDVARGRHMALQAATMLVTRAQLGNVGALRRLGIEATKVTTYEDQLRDSHVKANSQLREQAKALDLNATKLKVMEALHARFAGSAAAYSKTLSGRLDALHNSYRELEVEVGTAVTPTLTRFVTWLTKIITEMRESARVHEVLHVAMELVKDAAVGVVGVFKGVVSVVEFFRQHVLTALIPLLAVGLVGALVAVRWGLISIEMSTPWTAIAAGAVIAVGLIIRHWDTIKGWFATLWDYMKRTANAAWTAIVDLAKSAVYVILQEATAGIRGILEVASHLPFVGHKARAALDEINGYIKTWKPDFSNVIAAFNAGGAAAGSAFDRQVQQAAAQAGTTMAQAAQSSMRHRDVGGGGPGLPAGMGGGKGGAIAQGAANFLGTPYSWGGGHGASAGPTRGVAQGANTVGLDCSGLARAALASAGIQLPAMSADQLDHSAPYHPSVNELKPGDLVFYEGIHPGHVAVYIGGGKVIHAPHTGESVQIASVNMMPITGTARWWGGKDQSAPSPTRTPTPAVSIATTPSLASFRASLAAAPTAGAKHAAAGLSAAAVISMQGGVDATLGKLPDQLDVIERNAVAHLKSLRDSVRKGMTPADVATARESIKHWGTVLKDEINRQTTVAHRAAAAAAAKAAAAFNTQWTYATNEIHKQFQATTQKHLREMQAAFTKQMDEFDRETQQGLAALVSPTETPEERTLRMFQQARAATQLTKDDAQRQLDLAKAQAALSGLTGIGVGNMDEQGNVITQDQIDTAAQNVSDAQDAINQAALDEQEAGLQAQADLSRKAADQQAQQAQDAYQAKRDALKASLQQQETDAEQAYGDMRDNLAAILDADLSNWNAWIKAKTKTYQDFLAWLATIGFANPGVPPPDPFQGAASAAAGRSTPMAVRGSAVAMASGGDFMVDKPTLFLAGEAGRERATFSPAGGRDYHGDRPRVTYNVTVLGGTEQQVARALERLVTPEQNRRVGFTSV